MAQKKGLIVDRFPADQKEDFPFTKALIESIKDSAHPVEKAKIFKDTDQTARGLRIKINPSGKAVYLVVKRIRGKQGGATKRVIGNVGEVGLSNARKMAGKFIDWMADGKDPYEEIEKENRKAKIFTVRDAYKLFMSVRDIKDSTIGRYERQIEVLGYVHISSKKKWNEIEGQDDIHNTNVKKFRPHGIKSLLDADLNEINSKSILEIHKNVTNSHGHNGQPAHTEGDRVIQFLGSLYDIAIAVNNEAEDESNHIKLNPVKIMNRAKGHWNNPGGKTRRRKETLDTEHIAAHYEAIMQLKDLKNTPNENDKTVKYVYKPIPGAVRAHYFFRFMFWTGWRPGDVARMKWDQVEQLTENGLNYTVVSWDDAEAAERLKNGEEVYRVPLNEDATKVLTELRAIRDEKLEKAARGEQALPKNYDSEHIFLGVFENNHIKPNQHHYMKVVSELANIKHYPTSIYRKSFLTYGDHMGINVYTLKRLVFHTQNYFDVTSGYINTQRKVLFDASNAVADYYKSIISPAEYTPIVKSNESKEIGIDKDIMDELEAQYGDKAIKKCSDLIRIALAAKTLNKKFYDMLEKTTTELAEFEDCDFSDD